MDSNIRLQDPLCLLTLATDRCTSAVLLRYHEAGVKKCHSAFLEAVTFGNDQALNAIGLRHLSMDTHLVHAIPGSELHQRHQRMTRCLPSFLVIGTQKGGTSSFACLLKEGCVQANTSWHDRILISSGEKEIHYFSWDDRFRMGPLMCEPCSSPPHAYPSSPHLPDPSSHSHSTEPVWHFALS